MHLSPALSAVNQAEPLFEPRWIVVLVRALSGVIGSVVGAIMQRVFGHTDRSIDARQEWVKKSLQTVFGIGDAWVSSDRPRVAFMRLVPPHDATAHYYDMHTGLLHE